MSVRLKRWTEAELRAKSPAERRRLYDNAIAREGAPEADELLTLLEVVGVIHGESFKSDSPLGRSVRAVIFSDEGRSAALAAAQAGEAPMSRIDLLLQRDIGAPYRTTYEITTGAGTMVAALMRSMHWETNGRRQTLPPDRIAKTAALFVHIPPKKG